MAQNGTVKGEAKDGNGSRTGPLLLHVTTTDISLVLLLGPQLWAFRDAGYDVVGVSAPGPYVAELVSSGIRHIRLRHATRSSAPHRDLLALAELRSLFRQLRPDIVHTHNPKPGVYGRLAAGLAKVPVVVNTVHGLYALPEDRRSKRALIYGLERLASTCSHAELVQNPEDVEVLWRIGVDRAKLHLLGNGIDLAAFDPSRVSPLKVAEIRRQLEVGPDDVVCGAVGRLVWEKGYAELFAAAAELARTSPRTRIVVIGPSDPGKDDAIGEAALEKARLSGVHFLGMRRDVVELYAAMDLYVLASHREGFPRSAMEAAAMGLPIVATDIRGCRQVVDHDVTGLLVPARDAHALAEAIATLSSDSDRRHQIARAAREKAIREFDQERVIDTTLRTYERLLAEHKVTERKRKGRT
jgi:glycosyltransferase involved in cell wall biosynthesis